MVSTTFWGSAVLAVALAASSAWAAPSAQPEATTTAPATPSVAARSGTAKRPSGQGATEAAASGDEPASPAEVAPAVSRGARRSVQVLPPARPAEFGGGQPAAPRSALDIRPTLTSAAVSAEPGPPVTSNNWFASFFGLASAQPRGTMLPPLAGRGQIDALIAHHAKLNGVPESLVHRIVVRESKYNPRAVGRGGAMGLMQIKTATARAVGYDGGPAGLLDAETNLTYGIKYLAGAYRTAGGNHDLAVSHYARGYYYAARRQGLVAVASRRGRRGTQEAEAEAEAPAAAAPSTPSLFSFASRTASAASIEDRAAR